MPPLSELFFVPIANPHHRLRRALAVWPNKRRVRRAQHLKSIELVANANTAIRRELITMANDVLRQRQKTVQAEILSDGGEKSVERHPGGEVKHGGGIQLLRLLLFMVYNLGSCIS